MSYHGSGDDDGGRYREPRIIEGSRLMTVFLVWAVTDDGERTLMSAHRSWEGAVRNVRPPVKDSLGTVHYVVTTQEVRE